MRQVTNGTRNSQASLVSVRNRQLPTVEVACFSAAIVTSAFAPSMFDVAQVKADYRIMSQALPVVYLARHGETAWSLSGQHTGLTDLPLTERGERNARLLGERLTGIEFASVFTSPLLRAVQTCKLAGFEDVAERLPDLVEWNYGKYEGRRTAEIHTERPDWQLFRDGCPGGESPDQVGTRADQVRPSAPCGRWQRARLFQWAFLASPGSPLARADTCGGHVFSVEYG